MSCDQRVAVLPANNNQVIPLNASSGGCSLYNGATEPLYVCTGERKFQSNGPRTWYFAISRCDTNEPITMNYFFNFTGYYGECEADPLSRTVHPIKVKEKADINVIVTLGVLCGILAIATIILVILFVLNRHRRKKTKKGGSVTSSQATMTQDIFYVNPSLSDREHSDSQYSQSQSSGSENYYEVSNVTINSKGVRSIMGNVTINSKGIRNIMGNVTINSKGIRGIIGNVTINSNRIPNIMRYMYDISNTYSKEIPRIICY